MNRNSFIFLAISIVYVSYCQTLEPMSIRTFPRKSLLMMFNGIIKNSSITDMTSIISLRAIVNYSRRVAIDTDGDFAIFHFFNSDDANSNLIFRNNLDFSSIFRTSVQGLIETGFDNLNLYPKSPFEVYNANSSAILFNTHFDMFCDVSAGRNCEITCPTFNPNEEFCDPIDGRIRFINLTKHQADMCTINICDNDGVCYNIVTRSQCECQIGECGDRCERFICQETCNIRGGYCGKSGQCICYDGYSGIKCDIPVCTSFNYCLNNGMCTIVDGQHICNCNKERFTGVRCEFECSPECPGGECINMGGPFCFYDRFITVPISITNQSNPKPFELAERLNFTGLKIASAVLVIYFILILTSLLLVKKYFNFFESVKDKIGSVHTMKNTSTLVPSGTTSGPQKTYQIGGTQGRV